MEDCKNQQLQAKQKCSLYIIGTGLGNETSLSLKSIDILRSSDVVFIENYTSKSPLNLENLQNIIKQEIIKLDRTMIEVKQEFINLAKTKTISLLVIGTPLFATTHTQILIDAKQQNVKYEIIHNSSILNVFGCFGLYSYNYGRTISIPYFTNVKFYSFFDKIIANYKNKLHSLCLFDLNVELDFFMTPNLAINQILESENAKIKEGGEKLFPDNYKFFVLRNFGCDDQKTWYIDFAGYKDIDFGQGIFSMILPAPLELFEEEHVKSLFEN